jgi:hypothetical protein
MKPAHLAHASLTPAGEERCAADFIALLGMLAEAFPRAPVIVVICDNDSIHHARKVTAAGRVPARSLARGAGSAGGRCPRGCAFRAGAAATISSGAGIGAAGRALVVSRPDHRVQQAIPAGQAGAGGLAAAVAAGFHHAGGKTALGKGGKGAVEVHRVLASWLSPDHGPVRSPVHPAGGHCRRSGRCGFPALIWAHPERPGLRRSARYGPAR